MLTLVHLSCISNTIYTDVLAMKLTFVVTVFIHRFGIFWHHVCTCLRVCFNIKTYIHIKHYSDIIMGTINGVSNHQPHDCLLNRLFRHRSKKTSKLRVTGLCEENSPVTSEFPTHRASYAENVWIWWHHHAPGGAIEYGWGRVKTKKHWHRDYNKDMTKYVHIWVMSNELGISLQQSFGLCVKCFYRLKTKKPLIAMFMGPTRGPSGADRTQVGPMLASWTLLSGTICITGPEAGGFSTQNTSNAEYVSILGSMVSY